MRLFIKTILLVIPMGVLMVSYQQCSGVNFKNANEQSQWSMDCAKDQQKCRVVTENFNAGTSNKQIDFIWIVDNSASMSQEVTTVKNNMATFAGELGKHTDLRMVLLSASDNTTNPSNAYQNHPNPISLPSPMPDNVDATQINTLVRSRDALLLGGLGICPASDLAEQSWCRIVQSNRKVMYSSDNIDSTVGANQWRDQYSTVISKLSNFVREQSHKVYVIVSDDDSTTGEYHVKSEQFLDAYNSRFPHSQPIVYSIASLYEPRDAPAGCDIYHKSSEYMKLSAMTGGEFFDICASDWKPYFDKMLEGVTTLANTSFPLASINVVEILSVKLNGVALNPGDYTYANRVIKIRPELMTDATTYNVAVEILEYIN